MRSKIEIVLWRHWYVEYRVVLKRGLHHSQHGTFGKLRVTHYRPCKGPRVPVRGSTAERSENIYLLFRMKLMVESGERVDDGVGAKYRTRENSPTSLSKNKAILNRVSGTRSYFFLKKWKGCVILESYSETSIPKFPNVFPNFLQLLFLIHFCVDFCFRMPTACGDRAFLFFYYVT